MMRNLVMVALGGSAGAVLRYLISDWMRNRWSTAFPLGTLTVNVLGCLLMGILAHSSQASALSPATKLMITTGLLGALTTFSTFSVETLHCLHQHNLTLATLNIAANVLLSMVAVVVGAGIAKLL